jgi:hypothetical protein
MVSGRASASVSPARRHGSRRGRTAGEYCLPSARASSRERAGTRTASWSAWNVADQRHDCIHRNVTNLLGPVLDRITRSRSSSSDQP